MAIGDFVLGLQTGFCRLPDILTRLLVTIKIVWYDYLYKVTQHTNHKHIIFVTNFLMFIWLHV